MRITENRYAPMNFRMPAEPSPAPIQEPPDSPEGPDVVPVREPDPENPGEI